MCWSRTPPRCGVHWAVDGESRALAVEHVCGSQLPRQMQAKSTAEVNALSPSVSWSVGGSKPVATYAVTLTNTSASNTINNGRLVATTTVLAGSAGTQAVFKSVSIGATCSVSLGGTRVDCSVGSLAIGQPKTFRLNFESRRPRARVSNLTWDAVFDSGTPPGGSNGDSGTTGILASPTLLRLGLNLRYRRMRPSRSTPATWRSRAAVTNSRLRSRFQAPIRSPRLRGLRERHFLRAQLHESAQLQAVLQFGHPDPRRHSAVQFGRRRVPDVHAEHR